MADPVCPKGDCKGHEFDIVPARPWFTGPNQVPAARLQLVVCITCGAVVGVVDQSVSNTVERIAKRMP